MSILRFQHVRREIGTFVILDDVQAAVAHGERIGLVGANGAGKTTLLRLAAGIEEPDSGRVERKRGLRVSLLAQESNLDAAFAGAPSLYAAVRAGAEETERIERELTALEAAGAEAVAGARYAELRARFEVLDGYALDVRVAETLSGLGFSRQEWERPPTGLSGGQQTRAALARLLIADPDLLLLDEPTNHLDLDALEWLEQALARRGGASIVASHDRAFLDAVVSRIWELRGRRLTVYRGAYSAYAVQAAERDARLRDDADASRAAVQREEQLIQRFRSQRKYAQMHEHEKRLGRVEVSEAPAAERRMRLPADALLGGGPVRSGDVAVALRDLVAGFPPGPEQPAALPIVHVQRLEARRGERIGVVGPNGAGKTTLLRTIAGELQPLEGVLEIGAGVQLGYLAQLREAAAAGATVLDALQSTVNVPSGEARGYLARFLFRGDDVFKTVRELSGGERSRLELALLGVSPSNLLLLDEPTNHLDIPAREALEGFLRETSATVVLVSHDRRLLEALCDRLWVVAPGVRDGADVPGAIAEVAAFEGHYRAWRGALSEGWSVAVALERQAAGAAVASAARAATSSRSAGRLLPAANRGAADRSEGAAQVAPAAERSGRAPDRGRSGGAPGGAPDGGRSRGSRTKPTATRPVPLSKDAYRRQKTLIESDLTRLGLRKSQLELALGDPAAQANFVELRRISSELADVDQALAAAEDAWLLLEERAPR